MSCLKDYIGLKYCGAPVPPSGLYVNSLPGISLNTIDKTTDEDQVTFNGLWSDVQERSYRKFTTLVNSFFGQRYKLKSITESINLGLQLTDTTVSALGTYRGIELKLYRQSDLQSYYVHSVSVWSDAAANGVDVKVFDVIEGKQLWSTSKDLVKGWNHIIIEQHFATAHLLIGYNAALVSTKELSLLNKVNIWSDCLCNRYGCEADLKGVDFDGTTMSISKSSNSQVDGMSIYVSVRCRYDNFICSNRELFATAWWYLLGAELMQERLFSSRLNRFTTADVKKAEQLYQVFLAEFQRQLAATLDGVDLNTEDLCIECNEPFQIIGTLP